MNQECTQKAASYGKNDKSVFRVDGPILLCAVGQIFLNVFDVIEFPKINIFFK